MDKEGIMLFITRNFEIQNFGMKTIAIDADGNKTAYSFRPAIKFISTLGENLIGVEIGVFRGDNSKTILDLVKMKSLFCVDTWDFKGDDMTSPCTIEDFSKCQTLLRSYHNAYFIKEPSLEASKHFDDDVLDFIYIDASHLYEEVLQDINIWCKKVRVGGVIAGHDIKTPSVAKALSESNPTFQCQEDDWWFVKEPKCG